MKHIYLALLSLFIFNEVGAQIVEQDPVPSEDAEVIALNAGNTVYGKVVDIQSNNGIDAASVQLMARLVNAHTKEVKDSLIAAMLTKPNGDFSFKNLPPFDNMHLVVSAVGYGEYNRIFSLNVADTESMKAASQKNLGTIVLSRENERLEAVTIVAERPALRMGIDKKIFDVEKSLNAKGGTAVDVMRNIPSLSVDLDGNVELRNSTPTIFIDGRPTILTLDQIASDDIERIELITNPSAKYDASSTGGIINIILKKTRRRGINGIVSLNAGSPSRLSSNANINLRQGKFNFFLSGDYNYSANEGDDRSLRENKKDGLIDNYFEQNSLSDRERRFKSIRFGTDFFMNDKNLITLSQGYVSGKSNSKQTQAQEYFDASKTLDRTGDRVAESRHDFSRYNTQLLYTRKFSKEEQELELMVNANYGNADDESNINNSFYNLDGTPDGYVNNVFGNGANKNTQVTFQLGYVNPISETQKIETGVRSYVNYYESFLNSFSNLNSVITKLPLSNNYKFTENIYAAYVTYTGKLGSIGYQGGLRGEYSKFNGELIDSAQGFGYEYPNKPGDFWKGLFPSLYLSKAIGEKDEVQLNYSRRIRRPRFWDMNPFINISDPLNLQQGNPALKPEFTNSLEFNYSKGLKNNSNLLAVIYYRNTMGDITRYSDTVSQEQLLQLKDAAVDPNAILNTYINSKSVNRMGLELTLQQKFSKNFDVTPSVNFSYRKVNAKAGTIDLNNEGVNWNGKLTANYKVTPENAQSIFNKVSLQFSGFYESPRIIPQGRTSQLWSTDFSIRKTLLKKDRGTLTLGIIDIFDSWRSGTIYDTESFYQESYRRGWGRIYRISFSFKFGNSDFSLFKRVKDVDHSDSHD